MFAGYELEKPVISGNVVYDNETFEYVDTSLTNSLNLWAPGMYHVWL